MLRHTMVVDVAVVLKRRTETGKVPDLVGDGGYNVSERPLGYIRCLMDWKDQGDFEPAFSEVAELQLSAMLLCDILRDGQS